MKKVVCIGCSKLGTHPSLLRVQGVCFSRWLVSCDQHVGVCIVPVQEALRAVSTGARAGIPN